MATILTVHGTFAHLNVAGGSDDSASTTAYWWRPDSPFNDDLRSLVRGDDGDIDVCAFEWSGANSERERRAAGSRLYREMQRLEEAGGPYCVVAHSHGGSVASAALLEAASRQQELPGLKRWITVGTPFVELRKERFLFMRLPIILKAIYVASLMLLFMFGVAAIGRYIGGIDFGARESGRFYLVGLFAALPAVLFFIAALVRERRRRFFYRPGVKARALEYFGARWLPLTHEDDEAVRGLGALRSVSLPIFDKQFAVPILSLMAVFMLPVMYLTAINSPSLMVGLADFLRTKVYKFEEKSSRSRTMVQTRKATRSLRLELQVARKTANDTLLPVQRRALAQRTVENKRAALQRYRDQMREVYPEVVNYRRAQRFRRRFLERGGKLCNGGRYCDNGKDVALNANLLLHLATDEITSIFSDDEAGDGDWSRYTGWFLVFVLPVALVTAVLGLIAISWVLIVQVVARWFSRLASRRLDAMTWSQIRRAAVGNDTEDEIALGTAPYPKWAGASRPFLPLEVSAEITQCSNDATFQSLGKFREAISELAFTDNAGRATNNVLAYLNWNELIHTSYFVVPSFARLIALAVARSDGFQAHGALSAPTEQGQLTNWLAALERGQGPIV